ncbi:MAG: hypothetical protein LBP83_02505 [Dysgonamonadaceae bacterium]|nr:hypothetical protein [Dysgonamonadaceae bacterium]
MKELFSENLFSENIASESNDIDRSSLSKIKGLIEKNLSDSELNLEDLG